MKKIMFNTKYGLTDSVLKRLKTKTRRIIPQSELDRANEFQQYYFDSTFDALTGVELLKQFFLVENIGKLPYQVGEIVAIAQSYKDAGVTFLPEEDDEFGCHSFPAEQTTGWTNKMFVRADLMPHRIQFMDLHIERLQDISDEDCIKEGVEVVESFARLANGEKKILNYYRVPIFCPSGRVLTLNGSTPREVFAALINRISGKGTWESNPFVFAYDFQLVK